VRGTIAPGPADHEMDRRSAKRFSEFFPFGWNLFYSSSPAPRRALQRVLFSWVEPIRGGTYSGGTYSGWSGESEGLALRSNFTTPTASRARAGQRINGESCATKAPTPPPSMVEAKRKITR
jgi:hypothetical protein